jgi:hypothetical protein
MTGNRGFYEAVQTERGRQNFVLRVPGVDAFTISAYLAAASGIDPDSLGAILTSLNDENTQASAWVTLAEVRLKSARGEPRR